jgi:hypothetical protein
VRFRAVAHVGSDLFNFAFTYRKSDGYMALYKNDKILVENQYANLVFDSNENIILGNSAFQGNLHSLRLWNKYISKQILQQICVCKL